MHSVPEALDPIPTNNTKAMLAMDRTLDRRIEAATDSNLRSTGGVGGISEFGKREMYETFQTWALKTYGDSGKTKTVTSRKYNRIVRILSGDEEATTENSKFRFWVKAKGFKLGKLASPHTGVEHSVLYVPVKALNETAGTENFKEYKRVAIVEDFFDIIYGVHVEMDGRGGKHAGQKRTYRAIAETYSFLPREAVTRFLMACTDCQKRMHISSESNKTGTTNNNNDDEHLVPKLMNGVLGDHPHIVDFRVPITQTYINQLRTSGCLPWPGYGEFFDDSASSAPSEMSTETSPSPIDETSSPKSDLKIDASFSSESISATSAVATPLTSTPKPQGIEDYFPLNMSSTLRPTSISPALRDESKGHPERKRRASDDSLETSSKASETNEDSKDKDDDDDDDNDDDEKLLANTNIDPERLKSFNMFCRLFVDENLDRMVPISKQPKDKVQAILDACDRQFPEFHERSRKRIRTYLKSCRRMRRSKENGWEPLRPTPPHLTSAAAESYLAQACENESINAKRMKMGLEPLPVSAMPTGHHPLTAAGAAGAPPHTSPVGQKPVPSSQVPSPRPDQRVESRDSRDSIQATPTPTHMDRHTPVAVSSSAASDFLRSHQSPLTAFRPPPEFSPFFSTATNGNNGLFRPGFPGYQHPAHHHAPGLHSPIQPAIIQNGPTDLSMKKHSTKNQLSTSEMATIKQLISGYRESAAFLYRSADELEQLLLQQN